MECGVDMAGRKMVCCGLFAAVALLVALSPERVTSQSQSKTADESVPAFHAQSPRGTLPVTVSPWLFTDVVVQNAYTLAARVKKVLYQQPCYCHCDRSQGHKSLLDCFAGNHGSECGVCLSEAFYTYEQTRKGKTPSQIRQAIEKGEWHNVDISKYQTPITAE
jgi:Protein of unknown function with PCYCGC motif